MREITLYDLFALESRQQYKRPEFGRTAIHWKISLPVLKGGTPICLTELEPR
jgi:hypothetical protein